MSEDAPLTAREREALDRVNGLLAAGVPLTLLVDLTTPDGPSSAAVLEEEGLPADPWWEGLRDGRG